MNKLGIDCYTKGKARLMRRLNSLVSTHSVTDGGAYREDLNLSQIHLETAWTEEELDKWLYQTPGLDYIGTWIINKESA